MPPKLKRFVYDNFWWAAPVLFLAGLGIARSLWPPDSAAKVLLPLAGGLVGAYYFLQKQQLEELRLFERLFADFNRRYAELNERLQLLVADDDPLTKRDRALLEDYFNLCAEEYFYYTHGIIDPTVWRAWCRGILQYLHDDRIADFWRHEESTDSYYGLTLRRILAGAKSRIPLELVTTPLPATRSRDSKAA
jgi:hypothetical protein